MPKTAKRQIPSPAIRDELQKIARSLQKVGRENGNAHSRTFILIDGLDEQKGTQSRVQIAVSSEALDYIAQALADGALAKEPTVSRAPAELTTQQAADHIGVSRPYLIKLLEAGQIPFRRVGHFRRIRAEDLTEFERKDNERRTKGLQELADLTQEIGLSY